MKSSVPTMYRSTVAMPATLSSCNVACAVLLSCGISSAKNEVVVVITYLESAIKHSPKESTLSHEIFLVDLASAFHAREVDHNFLSFWRMMVES